MSAKILLVVVGSLFAVSAARGMGTFYDNFDNVSPGATPVPTTGSYNFVNGKVAADPGNAGSQVLLLQSPSTSTGGRNFPGVSPTAGVGDFVHFTFAAELVSGDHISFGLSSSEGGLVLSPGGQQATFLFSIRKDGTISQYTASGTSASYVPIAGLSHTVGAWQNYAVDYVVGSTSLAITAGSNTVAVTGPFAKANTTASDLYSVSSIKGAFVEPGLSSGADRTLGYADNVSIVPEPGLLGGTALVAAMLLLGRRTRTVSQKDAVC